jgi:hypothetical protein
MVNDISVNEGTHISGLTEGVSRLRAELDSRTCDHQGVIAVMSIRYPHVIWQSPTMSVVGNAELHPMVANLLLTKSRAWIAENPGKLID